MNGGVGVGGGRGMMSRKRRCRRVLILMALLLNVAACRSQEPPPPPEPPVATVNGEHIGRAEFEKKMAEGTALAKGEKPLKAEETASLKEEILDHLIEERIMLQRARELLLTVGESELEARIGEIKRDYNDDSFKALFGSVGISYIDWKEALRKRLLLEKVISLDVNAKIQVTDEEAERYFRINRRAYLSEGRVRAAQIVVHEQEQAERVMKRLKTGEDFDKVARDVSIGPEAARGGDLGFFERGVMPEVIDRVVFSLTVGKVSRVVQSPYGFHIFKVLGREEGGGRKYAEAKGRVIADLRKLKEAEVYERWIEGLKAKAVIQISRPLPDGRAPQAGETATPLSGEGIR
jgi:peptidyl-prolyl cis-trans isomerase C